MDGSELASAREVSMKVFAGCSQDTAANLGAMQWGQFINHDMQSTGQFQFGKSKIHLHYSLLWHNSRKLSFQILALNTFKSC